MRRDASGAFWHSQPVRICLVYDCLFPHTVGGAERWYRGLSEGLAAAGHDVTYLTMRQWDDESSLSAPTGVSVIAVAPQMDLYVRGRRRIVPPLVFGIGVLWHLLRHGGRYDAVHTASFPYFSLLAASLVRPLRRYRLVVDWHEVWTRRYWREYLGRIAGDLGWLVQRLCVGRRQRAFCPSTVQARRLVDEGFAGRVEVLGTYTGTTELQASNASDPLVVYAGRHIPEKRVPALVEAMARVRDAEPDFRCLILGDGPERTRVLDLIDELELGAVVEAPGFVSADQVQDALARATCLALPSSREGYGLVVIEAAAYGTPSVVVAGPDNAAVELVDEGVNGFVAASAAPQDLADAILRTHATRADLRESTRSWFAQKARELSRDAAVERVTAAYES
jgi:glycosyltransferase involved in cell wall biosynthesis